MLCVVHSLFVDLSAKDFLDRSQQEIRLPSGLVIIHSADFAVPLVVLFDLNEVMRRAVKELPSDLLPPFIPRRCRCEPNNVAAGVQVNEPADLAREEHLATGPLRASGDFAKMLNHGSI